MAKSGSGEVISVCSKCAARLEEKLETQSSLITRLTQMIESQNSVIAELSAKIDNVVFTDTYISPAAEITSPVHETGRVTRAQRRAAEAAEAAPRPAHPAAAASAGTNRSAAARGRRAAAAGAVRRAPAQPTSAQRAPAQPTSAQRASGLERDTLPPDDNNEREWTTVRRRERRPLVILRGTAEECHGLTAIERKRFLHIWSLHPDTSEELVLGYTQAVCPAVVCTAEKLRSKGDYASFKVGVPESAFDRLHTENAWPLNTSVKEWEFRRKSRP